MAVSGDLALTSLADILQLYAGRNETVAIKLESPLGPEYGGTLFLEAGEVVHASLAEFAGPLALKAALRMRQGRFTVERGVKSGRRTITDPLRKLLMDAHEEGAFDVGPSSPEEDPAMANFKDIPPPKKPTSLPPRSGPGSRPPLPPGDEVVTAPIAKTEPPPLDPTLPPPPRSRRGLVAVIAASAVIATVVVLVFALPKKAEEPALAPTVKAAPPAPPPELPPFTFGMVALTVYLGVWQVQRLTWKTALLDQIDQAEQSPPQPLTETPSPFARVTVTGTLRAESARYGVEVRATKSGAALGSQLLRVLDRPEGAPVLVDLGWVPEGLTPPAGTVTVQGYVRPPEYPVRFGAADDPAGRRFYALDPAAIGRALGQPELPPFTIVALGPAQPGVFPEPATALPRPVNNHLSYAVTWFGMALAGVVIFALYARKAARA